MDGQAELLGVTKRRLSGVNEGTAPPMTTNESWRIAGAEGSARERELSVYTEAWVLWGTGKPTYR